LSESHVGSTSADQADSGKTRESAAITRRRPRPVKYGQRCLYPGPVEPFLEARRQKSLTQGQTKTRLAPHLVCSPDGDPQTYALLHCSVFKDQTPEPGLDRAGLLTAPQGRGTRVTANIISSALRRVKEPHTPRPSWLPSAGPVHPAWTAQRRSPEPSTQPSAAPSARSSGQTPLL
jgi:hypothetical protein